MIKTVKKTSKKNVNAHKKKNINYKNKSCKQKMIGSGIMSSKQKKRSPLEELSHIEKNILNMTVSEKIATIKSLAPNLGKMLHIDKHPNDMSLKELLEAINTLGLNKGNAIEKAELVNLLNVELNNKMNRKIENNK
jgi:hypothetical protein